MILRSKGGEKGKIRYDGKIVDFEITSGQSCTFNSELEQINFKFNK